MEVGGGRDYPTFFLSVVCADLVYFVFLGGGGGTGCVGTGGRVLGSICVFVLLLDGSSR